MNMNRFKIYYLLTLCAVTVLFASCSTSRWVALTEIRPMAAQKLMRKVERESPSFNSYGSKKVNIEYTLNNQKNSFSGQFKLKRNECLIASARKFTMTVGKGMITPDSIVFINYFDRSFLSGTFDDIKKVSGADVSFNLIEALLTGDISHIIDFEIFDRSFTSSIDSQMYRIDSPVKNIALAGKKNKNVLQQAGFENISVWVDPQKYVVRKISLSDNKQNQKIGISYGNYESIKGDQYPQEVIFDYITPSQKTSFTLSLSKSEVNSENDFSFSVPEKYEKLKLNGL